MKKYLYIIVVTSLSLFIGCEQYWEEHYGEIPETVDQKMWDNLKSHSEVSSFVALMEQYKLDTLFGYNETFTLFVPGNEAIARFQANNVLDTTVLMYHILKHFINPVNIQGAKKIQTLRLKFAQFEKKNGDYLYDNIPVTYSSPLFLDGRYFIISEVAQPRPSLYEYISMYIPALKQYIDDQDSIILDKERSKPLGFDEEGNTVYDSVITVINLFEEEFFEVSEEFRLKTATLVFPKGDLYNQGLAEMAGKLGIGNQPGDIPEEWQQDVLIPYLIESGLFPNLLEPRAFTVDSVKNILGDSVYIAYQPVEKTLCSNGYAYNYNAFSVPDTLFQTPLRSEGERFLEVIGSNRFAWNDSVVTIVESDQTFVPTAQHITGTSNDSVLVVNFPNAYDGKFTIELKTKPQFPRRYLMLVRTHMDYGGIYDIYVNDVLVKTIDYYDFTRMRGVVPSVVPGVNHVKFGRFIKFDFWVENITEYGAVTVKFEYKGPTNIKGSALFLDYFELLPESKIHTITNNP
ncbi:MAG TPA: fasciclin domain-containing protein [Prolixibacteraceae bacterium]|nr:fasciclin domain-containing protein [Prolixibacteraceae bacterium]